jgi:hypothetical protein
MEFVAVWKANSSRFYDGDPASGAESNSPAPVMMIFESKPQEFRRRAIFMVFLGRNQNVPYGQL